MFKSLLGMMIVMSVFAWLQGCQQVNDCPCGEVCVTETDIKCDVASSNCTCKTGCTVFDVYIPVGGSKTLYNNICGCMVTHEPITSCTAASWFGQPDGMEPFEDNTNCQTM